MKKWFALVLAAMAMHAHGEGLTPFAVAFGAVSGGGGKGVVCRRVDNSILSVRLLDLWEAETLYGETPILATGQLAADVEHALQGLKDAYPYEGSVSFGPNDNYQNQDAIFEIMRRKAKRFLTWDSEVKRLTGVTLTLTDDLLNATA